MNSVGYGKSKRRQTGGSFFSKIGDYVKSHHLASKGLNYAANALSGTKYAALAPIVSYLGNFAAQKGWGGRRRRVVKRPVKSMVMGTGKTRKRMIGGDNVNRMKTLIKSLHGNGKRRRQRKIVF